MSPNWQKFLSVSVHEPTGPGFEYSRGLSILQLKFTKLLPFPYLFEKLFCLFSFVFVVKYQIISYNLVKRTKESVTNEKKTCASVDLFGHKLYFSLSDIGNIYATMNFQNILIFNLSMHICNVNYFHFHWIIIFYD